MIFKQQSDQVNELYTALAAAQGEMDTASKSAGMASNYGQNKRYATYDDMVAATRPALTKNKLSVYHDIIEYENGERYLYTCLAHGSGQWKAGWMHLDVGDNKARNKQQELGSCLTYYKRYAYAAAVGLSFDDGDDYDSPKYQQSEQPSNDGPSEAQLNLISRLIKENPTKASKAITDLNISMESLSKSNAGRLITYLKGE